MFAELIRVRIDRLYVLAHRVLRDVERGEDALQDALVTAWRDLPGLRDAERFDAWLYRIVVRSARLRQLRSGAASRTFASCPGRPHAA